MLEKKVLISFDGINQEDVMHTVACKDTREGQRGKVGICREKQDIKLTDKLKVTPGDGAMKRRRVG